jgi:polyhydroxyalkanoate synthase
MKKNEKTINFEEIKTPDFSQINDIFENNLKIYNNFVKNISTNTPANKDTQTTNGVKNTNGQNFTAIDLLNLINPTTTKITNTLFDVSSKITNNPKLYYEHIGKWIQQIASLNFYFISRLSNQPANPIIEPNKTDKRFASPEWSENIFFDFIKQFYLLTSRMMDQLVDSIEHIDPKQKQLVKFYTNQINAAFSPTNFVATNPELINQTIQEGAQNLVRGFENFKKDYLKHPNKMFISQTADEFKVGENIGNTKGSVIFKNDVFELIHYTPETDEQFEKPMLVIPPFINKFYIMDLNEKKSMIKYLVERKQNTFLISWKNPKSDSKDFGFNEYINDGVLKALDVVCDETGSDGANTASYCVGGTLTAMVLAHLANQKNIKNKILSSTFFTSLVDFTEPGDLGVFISEEQISMIEKQMQNKGYFDGKDMAACFNFLRPGDLYWNYVINNYLKGNQPSAFDMLYWNSDSTRIPEVLHSDYLRSMYLNNLLTKKEYKFDGQILDMSKIKTPMFHVATTEDHIAPWKSVFMGLAQFNSNIEFTLANSGHIAGIIQGKGAKPGKQYYFENKKMEKDSDKWLENAKKIEGSWWPKWMDWLKDHSGEVKKVNEINLNKFKEIYKAPGKYVLEK